MSYRGWAAVLLAAAVPCVIPTVTNAEGFDRDRDPSAVATATPIKHLVVIFQENNSFDHYFGTYPNATNPPGEPKFQPREDTPSINGLSEVLLNNNPNLTQPFRLDRSQAALNCDNNNGYSAEQSGVDHGLVDMFQQKNSAAASPATAPGVVPALAACPTGIVMGYYDGNTVTALWNYAQQFAMSDNFLDTEFGVTLEGHLNLVSGQTHQTNVVNVQKVGADSFVIRNGSIIANLDSALDDCRAAPVGGVPVASVAMTGHNVGDLIAAVNGPKSGRQEITWGWFYGNFDKIGGACDPAYDDHHVPFQYYPQTANPHHFLPSSTAAVGHTNIPGTATPDPANHQYSLTTFWKAVAAGRMPAVSFLKAPEPANGHPQNSDALSEQKFLVDTINALQRTPEWKDMAVIITYDDSDGWYDHVMPPIINQSNDPSGVVADGKTVTIDTLCGGSQVGLQFFGPGNPTGAFNDRCGYGERMPFLVISPFAKRNYVDHALADTSSVLRFIEDNWLGGMRIDALDHPDGSLAGNPPRGQESFDRHAGSIEGVFDFDDEPNLRPVILDDQTGEVLSDRDHDHF